MTLALVFSISLIIMFYCISNLFLAKLQLCEMEKPIYGCSLFIIVSNLFYFLFKLSFVYFFFFFIFLFLFSIFFIKLKNFKNFLHCSFILLPSLILIFILIQSYGDQFLIFRGNIWDLFTYVSVSKLILNFSLNEVLNLTNMAETDGLEDFYKIYKNEIFSRPSISFLSAFIYSFNYLDLFQSVLSIKFLAIFFSILSISILIKKIVRNFILNILVSNVFILSHFFFYNFEIDAYSLIVSMPFLILLLHLLPHYSQKLIENDNNYFFKLVLLSSGFFIIYPNSACIFLLIFLIFVIHETFKNNLINKKNLINLFFYIIIFFVLISPTYKSTIMYLLRSEIPVGLIKKTDFWGYYGAFILGKDNPIYNPDVVSRIKELWSDGISIVSIFFEVIKLNLDNKNYFFILNILPSVFGFYHFTTSSSYGFYNIILILILIYCHYLIFSNFYNLIKNYKSYNLKYLNFYKIHAIFYFTFSIFLLLKGQIWPLIKLFFFFSVIFYFFIIFKFKNKKISIRFITLIFLLLLPFYKYNNFNNGIGVLDTYPSILKVDTKSKINWRIDKNKLNNCKTLKTNLTKRFEKLFISINYSLKKKIKTEDCLVTIKNKKFIIN